MVKKTNFQVTWGEKKAKGTASIKSRLGAAGGVGKARRVVTKGSIEGQWKHDMYQDQDDDDEEYAAAPRRKVAIKGANAGKWKHDMFESMEREERGAGRVGKKGAGRGLPTSDLRWQLSTNTDTKRLVTIGGARGQVARGAGGKASKSATSLPEFLRSLELSKYLAVLKQEEIDLQALRHMSDEDLQSLDIPMGPRKKIARGDQDA